MKKILLTSNGLSTPKIMFAFKSLFINPIENVSILFIPTASRTENEMVYVKKSYNELIESGVKKNNIIWLDIDKIHESSKYFDSVDCIFVCGGNTYYLLSKLKESGLDHKIISSIAKGIAYVGVSAGSIIASPSIDYIGFLDENDTGLINFNALELIDQYVIPHYEKSFNNQLTFSKTFVCITDESAILYDNNMAIII